MVNWKDKKYNEAEKILGKWALMVPFRLTEPKNWDRLIVLRKGYLLLLKLALPKN